jgi:hypothetical protein
MLLCCRRPQHDVKVLRQFQDTIMDLLKPNQQQQQQQQRQQSGKEAVAAGSVLSCTSGIASSNSSSSHIVGNSAGLKPAMPTGPAFALAANSSSIATPSSCKSNATALVSTARSETALATSGSSSKALATTGSSTNKCWKAWQAAHPALLRQLQGQYNVQLARFYMWTQTAESLLLAVHMPTGESCCAWCFYSVIAA